MAIVLTDTEIAQLIAEPKVWPDLSKLELKPKRGHKERDTAVTGKNGGEFQLILRQSMFNPLDFSVILGYQVPKSTQLFRLRRYNGKNHEHTNKIEGTRFYDFHIHMRRSAIRDWAEMRICSRRQLRGIRTFPARFDACWRTVHLKNRQGINQDCSKRCYEDRQD
jgi:hypothetical protein